MSETSTLPSAQELSREHPGAVRIGKIGWFAKGVVYTLAGVLAIVVFAHAVDWREQAPDGTEASPTGAVKTVADSPGGPILLIALAAGLFLYALWRLVTVFVPGHLDAESGLKRAGYFASALMYLLLGWTAISLTRRSSATEDGDRKVTDVAVRLMDNAVGRWAIGIVGVILIGAGLYRWLKVLRKERDEEVDLSGMSPARRRAMLVLQAVGDLGRGLAVALVGYFLVRSAVTYNAAEATGLDGALRRLASSNSGAIVVGMTGLGLVAYGVYCLLTFNRRKLRAP